MRAAPVGLLAAILCLAGPVRASEPDDVPTVAKRIAAAFQSGGGEAVAPILAESPRDAWLVTEQLAADGALEAAKAYAALAEERSKTYSGLVAYAARRVENPPPQSEMNELRAITALLEAEKHEEALARLRHFEPKSGGMSRAQKLRLTAWVRHGARNKAVDVIAAYTAAADAAREIGWVSAAMVDLDRATMVAYNAKAWRRALELTTASLPLALALEDLDYERRIRWYAALALRRMKRYEPARVHALRAWELSRGTGHEAQCLRTLLMIEIPGGYTHAARRHLDIMAGLDFIKKHPNQLAANQIHMASLDITLGRPTSALVRMQKALEWFEENGEPGEKRGVNLHAGKIWLNLNQPQRSLEHLRKARIAGEGLGFDDTLLYYFEGRALFLLGKIEEAERALRTAMEASKRGAPDTQAAVRASLAHSLALLGRFDEAYALLDEAREALKTLKEPSAVRGVELVATRVHLEAGKYDEAIQAAKNGLRFSKEGLLTRADATFEMRLAEAWLGKGEAAKALAHARAAIEMFVRETGPLPAEVGAQQRLDFKRAFWLATEAAVALGDADSFFETAEQSRAVALRTRMDAHEITTNALSPALRAEEEKLEEAEALAVRAYRIALRTRKTERIKTAYDALTRAREALEQHRVRIRAEQAVIGQVLSPVVDSLAQTRARLAKDEALVVYARGRKHVHALVATRAAARLVGVGPQPVATGAAENSVFEEPALSVTEATSALRLLFVKPLALPERIRRVAIVPTGRIAFVPFATLLAGREVVFMPSATVGRMLAGRPPAAGSKVLAVGTSGAGLAGTLPAATEEARAIGTMSLVDKAATEEAVRRGVGAKERWRALHLACHGLIDTVNPLRCALALLPSEDRDGLWTVSEILGTPVNADLVALSACSTARGKVFQGEGVMGFVHAFFVAGAKRVLVSLWDVDDAATAALMKRFYAEWKSGLDGAAALRKAQDALRLDPRWQHPSYWAGWQLWGVP